MTIQDEAGLAGLLAQADPRGIEQQLSRIAELLERLVPAPPKPIDLTGADAFIWHPDGRFCSRCPRSTGSSMELLRGIDRMRDILTDNTERFAKGLPPITRCYGAPAAWANPRWSKPPMPTSTRASPDRRASVR